MLLAGLTAAWQLSSNPVLWNRVEEWADSSFMGGDPSYSNDQFEIDLVDRINYTRRLSKLSEMHVDAELETWMRSYSESIKADDLDGLIAMLQIQQPRYFQVRVGSARAKVLRDLAEQFQDFSKKIEPQNEHMGVLVRRQPTGFGYEAILVTGQRMDNFSPESLNARKADTFFSICPHCKHPHPCKASIAQRGIKLDCPSCGRDYGVLAPDERGKFRFVNDFLTGYQPPARYSQEGSRLHEMFTIWSAVVNNCVYTKDTSDKHANRDAWQFAVETITRGRGDCEDSSLLLADWLISRGFNARVALGRYGDLGQHAWVVTRVDGIDYLLESTEGHPSPEKPPYLADVGARYVPETLFDREALYVRSNPSDHSGGDYWSSKTWVRIEPKKLFSPTEKGLLASTASKPSPVDTSNGKAITTAGKPTANPNKESAGHMVSTASRSNARRVTGVPIPPFSRVRDLMTGATQWQLSAAVGASVVPGATDETKGH